MTESRTLGSDTSAGSPADGGRPLRLAIIKPGKAWRAWERAALNALAASPQQAGLAVLTLPDSQGAGERTTAALAARVGARSFRPAAPPAGDPIQAESCTDAKDAAQRIEAAEAKFLVWLGLDPPPTELIRAAERCLSVDYRSEAPALDGRARPLELVRLTVRLWCRSRDGTIPIAEAVHRPPVEKGLRLLVDSAFVLAPALLARSLALAAFQSAGRAEFPLGTPETAAHQAQTPTPGRVRLAVHYARAVLRRLLYGVVFREVWALGLVEQPVREILAQGSLGDVRWLAVPGRLASLADPSILDTETGPLVLAERLDGPGGKGRIVAAPLSALAAGNGVPWRDTLREAHHLSFPGTFRFEGTHYLVPEAYESGQLWAYRQASEGPDGWERLTEPLLPDVPALDPAVFEHEGRWWLLAGIAGRNPNVNLYAWFANSPLGPWTEHALNPVKSDVRASRSAGRPFRLGDDLYRPAQDCSETYGGALVVQRMTALTPTDFREEAAAVFRPVPGMPYGRGLHSLCPAGEVTLIDGKAYRFTLWAALCALLDRPSGRGR